MKKLLLLLLLYSACTYSYAQTPDIKFDHIGIKEGLPGAEGQGSEFIILLPITIV